MQGVKPGEPKAASGAVGVPVHVRKKVLRKAEFMDRVRSTARSAPASRAGEAAPLRLSHPAKGGTPFCPKLRLAAGKKNTKRRAVPAALQDLSAIRAALEESAGEPQKAAQGGCQGRGGGKKRMQVTVEETGRLQQVLAHPVYAQDPLAALHEHLQASLPAAPAPEKPQQKQKQKQARGRRRGKARGVAGLAGAVEGMQLS